MPMPASALAVATRFLADPGAARDVAAELAAPLGVAFALTAVAAIVLWRTRTALRPAWVMGWTALVVGAIVVVAWRNERFEHRSAGIPLAELAWDAQRWDEVRRAAFDPAFQLECGRHLAPARTLESVRDRCYAWRAIDRDDAPVFDRELWPKLIIAADGLTRPEVVLLERWVRQWSDEASHLALALSIDARPAIVLDVSDVRPAWTGARGEKGRTSFDHPPATRLVREAMARALPRARPGVAAYIRRSLELAQELDARVGFSPDPAIAAALAPPAPAAPRR